MDFCRFVLMNTSTTLKSGKVVISKSYVYFFVFIMPFCNLLDYTFIYEQNSNI